MDELRGPNIQIVLHVKEGLGFGFLRAPFIVTGSLNGYILETDPTIPCHGPMFDAELVWEADKRRFRNLRVQNVPVKVEVHTMGTQGKKDKVGYLLLSLLGAQPCPANKIIDIKHSWHRLLGVKSQGKCCHPQLLLSLSIEDRISIPTPRNEMRMFHSNETAYISSYPTANPGTSRTMLSTVAEYIAASKKTVQSADLQPKLISDEGLIQIGDGTHHFILSFVIGAAENLNLLLPLMDSNLRICCDCFVKYSVFSHDIQSDRVPAIDDGGSNFTAHFNQRTSLRLRTELVNLTKYFSECPLVVIRLCSADKDFGICSIDLRKLFPTDNLEEFLRNFCNDTLALTIHERCFILPYEEKHRRDDSKRSFLDVEYSLKYVQATTKSNTRPTLGARSVTQLETMPSNFEDKGISLQYKGGSCTQLDPDVGGVAYTNMPGSSARHNPSGDAPFQTSEIAAIIKKMCETFTESQEKLFNTRLKATTSDMQVQCDLLIIEKETDVQKKVLNDNKEVENCKDYRKAKENEKSDMNEEDLMKSDNHIPYSKKDQLRMTVPREDREALMKEFVDELEDWKEKQQELYKIQLQRKEEYHLDLLAKEWAKKRVELECKLSKGIEQCRTLANQLSVATEELRMRPYRNAQREKKLIEAKSLLEQHYAAKFQELREASVRMEQDMQHQIREKDMKIDELRHKLQLMEKQVETLQKKLKSTEIDNENKHSGLTKDQTASLIHELRCLEEKLEGAVQSKAFFKAQWGRAVRELHAAKLTSRRHVLSQLQRDRTTLHQLGFDSSDAVHIDEDKKDLEKLKDNFYVDLLEDTDVAGLEARLGLVSNPGGFEMYGDESNIPKNPVNEKISELITRRDSLMREDSPDEELLTKLNQDIRNMLLNCGT